MILLISIGFAGGILMPQKCTETTTIIQKLVPCKPCPEFDLLEECLKFTINSKNYLETINATIS